MFRSNSDSTTTVNSPTPISPFSNDSVPSEPTSDEQPNLGAFTTVFREWTYLQPPRRPVVLQQPLSSSETSHTSSITPSDYFPSEFDSDAEIRPDGSTVWAQIPIASYLKVGDTETETDQDGDYLQRPGGSKEWDLEDEYDSSDTEGDRQSRTVYIADGSDEVDIQSSRGTEGVDLDLVHDDHPDQVMPSLGFQEALSFLADERERFTAQRAPVSAYNGRLMSLAAASVEPRRKRRRRRTKAPRSKSIGPVDAEQDADESSSSYEYQSYSSPSANINSRNAMFKSTPGTPSRRPARLRNTKSTPQLRPPGEELPATPSRLFITDKDSPRVKQMKGLAEKLHQLFPEDGKSLKHILFGTLDTTETNITTPLNVLSDDLMAGFVDTRGPSPEQTDDRLIHVFVDHSNILIGLLNYLKRYPQKHPQYSVSQKLRHLSHSALTLLLERGRPVTRRVIVASSPLYQPMLGAEQLGYEVRVFARVPDTGDGMDRTPRPSMGLGHTRSHSGSSAQTFTAGADGLGMQRRRSGSINNHSFGRKKGHTRKISGSTSTESEQGAANGVSFSQAFLKSLGPNGASALSTSPPLSQASTPPARIRYREQGVDELLQLKLHQAIASVDATPPPGSTIVLATGDGNVGQFNEDGFLGSVRTALKRGWNVELYAWEGGLSKAWKREFGEGSEWNNEKSRKFKIIGMEQFGSDLVEIY